MTMIQTNCVGCGKLIQVSGPLTPEGPPVCWKCADPEIHLEFFDTVYVDDLPE